MRPLLALSFLSAALLVFAPGCSRRDALSYGETGQGSTLSGEGASFPKRLYLQWIEAYKNVDPRAKITYVASNSGNGQSKISSGAVTFGASDFPLDGAEGKGILQIPTTLGAVVVSYRLPDNPQLRLSADVLSKIYQGGITSWSDDAIRALNPGLKATGTIRPLYRADSSGTNTNFTDYLSRTGNAHWKRTPNLERASLGSLATGVPGGGEMVNALNSEGSIGYLDYSDAASTEKHSALPMAVLVKVDGMIVRDVAPSLESIAAAAEAQNFESGGALNLIDAKGEAAYPIVTMTYLLVRRETKSREDGLALARFLWWATHEGQKLGPPLRYVPLPPEVVLQTETQLRRMSAGGTPAITET